MRKLFCILCSCLTIFPFLLAGNLALAQEKEKSGPTSTTSSQIWINLSDECVKWVWKWCFNTDKILWIRVKSDDSTTVISVIQDVILAATWLVWTVLTLVLIYCGFMYIIASGWDSWKASKMKDWMIKAGIGALLVRCAYGIVRLIQYIAQW